MVIVGWYVLATACAASDSDDNDMPSHAAKPADVTAASNFPSKLHGARIVKYNFLDLSK